MWPYRDVKNIESRTKELLEEWTRFIKTIKSDNGKESPTTNELQRPSGSTFTSPPYHSWERGANENPNLLVRRYFPKGTNFDKIEKETVKKEEII